MWDPGTSGVWTTLGGKMASEAKSTKAKATADRKSEKKKVKRAAMAKSRPSVAKAMEGIGAKAPQKFGRGKKYLATVAKVDKNKQYPLNEAVKLVQETSPVKFDATVEMHIQMGVDPKKSDQNIRGTVTLPAGRGKVQRVLVLAEEADAKKAKAAGADHAGLEEMIEKIEKGWLDFDIVIATPAVMPKVGKLGQTLGTKGMMPNPKSGTVAADVEKAVKEFKAGKIEFRLDKDAIIHLGIGKVSFKTEDLVSNINALITALRAAKPSSAKGTYIKKITLASTMGPGVKVDLNSL